MNSVHLIMHRKKENPAELAKGITNTFRSHDFRVSAEPWLCRLLGADFFDADENACEAIVAVGGDGTLLRANHEAIRREVPVLGVNAGHIGFLVETEPSLLDEACTRLQNDDYLVDHRMMLDIRMPDGRVETALNDVVISRGGYSRLIAVRAKVGDELIGRYIADGLIVSTPTGSTGYSLSAGGPIIYPEVECILLSPICAHSLQHRPVIASASQRVTLELDCDPEQSAQLDADGQTVGVLCGKDTIVVTRSLKTAKLIRFGEHGFFSRVHDKLSEWSC